MTSPEILFELAAELATSHRRSEEGRIRVLPVLVENLSEARIVLDALCGLVGGRLLSADDDELQVAVPATRSLIIPPAVEAALTTVPLGGTRRVVLERTGGLANAAFIDPPAGPDPSPGERTILAVARAVMHEDLDSSPLGIITWRDSGVDLRLRSALWRLGVDQLSEMPHPTLRSLLMVAETRIDVNLHCQVGRGFRYAIQNGRLLRRHGRDSLRATVRQIAENSGPFVLFLGAGFSASSKFPLGNALRDQAIRRLLGIDAGAAVTSHQLARRFHDWIAAKSEWMTYEESSALPENYISQLTLEQVVRAEKRLYPDLPTLQEFREHHDRVIGVPGGAALDLASILRLTAGRVIVVEVNFDLLVERYAETELKVFASDDEFQGADHYIENYLTGAESAIPVLKVHGSIDRLETCVVSDDQTEIGVGKSKLDALRALLSEDSPRPWIYVGTSMRDRDLLRVFADEDWARGVDEQWVSPYLEDTVEDFAMKRRPFWSSRPLRSIDDRLTSETADSFFSALREAFEHRVT